MNWKQLVLWVGLGLAIVLAGLAVMGKPTLGMIQTVLLFMASVILLGSVAWNKLTDKNVNVGDVGNAIMLVFGILVLISAFVSIKFITAELPTWLSQATGISVVITGLLIGWNGFQASK